MILSSCPSRPACFKQSPDALNNDVRTLLKAKTNIGRSCYSLTENFAGEIGKTSAAARAAAIDAQEQ